VGAALLDAAGSIHTGCNVESASYGLTICAERTALGAAVSQGAGEITHVVVLCDAAEPVTPCGACRQLLWELAPGAKLILATLDGKRSQTTVKAMLPRAFDAQTLKAAPRRRRRKG
jgi:cytidine deaminase